MGILLHHRVSKRGNLKEHLKFISSAQSQANQGIKSSVLRVFNGPTCRIFLRGIH